MPSHGLDPDEFRRLGRLAVEIAAEHLARAAEGPVFRPMEPAERKRLLEQPLPARGEPADASLSFVREHVLAHPMGNGHPRFFGWVNSPPAPAGVIAEVMAAALNPSVAGGDHASVYLERCGVRWIMELIGFPAAGSMGLLASGGSMANLIGLAAARHWAAQEDGWSVREEGLQGGRPRMTLYLTHEGHSCLRKAAELLGLGGASLQPVPVDDDLRMRPEALRELVRADRAAGRRPFCVAASAGTVNTGAIDPLEAIADVCETEGLWLHVDGAYGAFGAALAEMAAAYAGMARARSIALDPHKWLSVPVECGCALVRDGALLRDAFSLVPPYLRTEEGKGFGGLPWFSEYGPQQTRGFRALKLWMTLRTAGRDGIEGMLRRNLAMARRLAERVDASPELERLAPVPLSIVCFRYVSDRLRGQEEQLDALNKRIMERIQSEGEAFVSSTQIRGRFALRACVLHYATAEADVDALTDVVRRVGRELSERPAHHS
jgi:glutamate/tyrosine decarboxylase-like PLP-dependent enzyme